MMGGGRLACIGDWGTVGLGRGDFILFRRLSTSPSPSPSTPPLPSYCLAWKCVQYGSIGRAGTMEGRTYNGGGGESVYIARIAANGTAGARIFNAALLHLEKLLPLAEI